MKRGQQGKGASRAFGGATPGSSLSYLAEPPSFSAVADPNVVVSLKNVLKKDTTTKAKALEDLVHHVQAHPYEQGGGVDEALLDIWVQIYPRIAIDNSRRVRELSHNLQLELIKSARKRMERHIPNIVGPWLAGLYDRDRVVARAANFGLTFLLNTPQKMSAFWSKCQPRILDYAIEAAQESRDTLSDERSTTLEDAEAKYFRVLNASLSLVLRLLQLDDGGVERSRQRLDDFFAEEVVWNSITFNDAQVRKAACHLLFACLERHLPYAESAKARQAFITGGLKTNQSGSALDYVQALTRLTQHSPRAWTASSSEKKSPFMRLQAFIAKGSQGSPPKFWECLGQLIASLPTDVLTLDTASSLLSSLMAGIASRDEPRTNTSLSWKCYVDAAKRCLNALSDDELDFAKQHLFPLFEGYLFPVSENPMPIPCGPSAMSTLVDIYLGLVQSSSHLTEGSAEEWAHLGTMFCTDISASLPEVSTEYQASQTKIGEEGRLWFGLVGLLHSRLQDMGQNLVDQTAGPSKNVIFQCIMLLESRNMKPFGVAQILEYAASMSPHLFTAETGRRFASFLLSAGREHMGKVVQSVSYRNLFSCLCILGTIPGHEGDYKTVWQSWVEAALGLSSATQRNLALTHLVSQERAAPIAQKYSKLQEAVHSQARKAIEGNEDEGQGAARELLEAAIRHQALDLETGRKIANDMVTLLATETQHTERILEALEIVASTRPELFSQQETIHTDLVAQLLGLTEVGDSTISPRASKIRSLLDGHGQGTLPAVEIIQTNLERAGPQALEISTLIIQAMSAADANVPWEEIFPSTNVWIEELSKLLERPIDPALSITSTIGGAVTLPRITNTIPGARRIPMSRDRKGRSVPARMALYTCRILSAAPEGLDLPRQFHIELLYLQCLSVQLASDQITTLDHDGLWLALEDDDAAAQAEELITSSGSLVNKLVSLATRWDEAVEHGMSGLIRGLVDLAMKEAMELTPRGVYSSRVLSELLQALTEAHGAPSSLEDIFPRPDVLNVKPDTALLAAGLITGLGDSLQSSKAASNFCNRLVSDITSVSPEGDKAIMTLVLFTLCAQIYPLGGLPVASNRVVFAVKQITRWTEDAGELDVNTRAEICRALGQLLPCMKDVYGSYWENALQFCVGLWERASQHTLPEALPFIHASLKLFKVLEGLHEPNDDLQDALRDLAAAKSNGLVELLKLPRGEISQSMDIVDALLCRETEKIAVARIPEPTELFPLVASESRDIQTAAFNMLHRKIPAKQEQNSIDVLLDKTDARLPDELLSLLLEPPTLEKFPDEVFALFPSSIRCYLLSWKLLFDTFSASSFKIRNDFTEHLKTGDFVNPLLDFLFDALGHSAAHPLSLDREGLGPQQICDYDISVADSEVGERSMYWLLAHLYYLTLKYIPGLFKAWYINCRSKQTRTAVESWTTKYYSPLIIADTLDGVQEWADSQESPASDEQELLVKVSKTAREVTAGYEVDELHAAIVIKIPSNYPIEGVSVAGLKRVAVTERKWQSWIMTTQGVITFSNGNIIDGLQVLRRNIVGALKGQSECAICYSIISTDKRMPDKRCTTCKNLFHRTCLYKWFQTSNQNTCPLCRNPIDYLGSDTAKRRQM